MLYYIPENIDLSAFSNNIKSYIHLEKYYYFLSLLTEMKIFKKNYENNDFIRLKSVYLRNIMTTRKSKEIIKNLEKWGFIEIDNSYQVNNYSKGYRLKEKYQNQILQKIKMSQKIINRLNKWLFRDLIIKNKFKENILESNDFFNNIKKSEKYSDLKNHFEKLNIDYNEAIKYINSLNINKEKRNLLLISVDKIYNKDFFFKHDDKSNRIFTNLTSLQKQLRKFLTYENKKLIQLDISNSQPLLFSLCLPKKSQHKDIYTYIQLVKNGNFYQYMYEIYQNHYNINISKDEFKKQFFNKVFFCRKFMNNLYKESILFKKIFPNVFETLIFYKNKMGYKNFIFFLQKIESKIIIKNIALKLAKNIPIFTIHDSLITTIDNFEILKKEIEITLKKYNLSAILKIK